MLPFLVLYMNIFEGYNPLVSIQPLNIKNINNVRKKSNASLSSPMANCDIVMFHGKYFTIMIDRQTTVVSENLWA